MRRPLTWLEPLVLWPVLLLLIAYGGLWIAFPPWVVRQLTRHSKGQVAVERAILQFPFTLVLSQAHVATFSASTSLQCERITLRPRWWSWTRRTLWLETVEVEQPSLRFARTQDGTLAWPSLNLQVLASADPDASPPAWRVVIQTLRLVNGSVVFLDAQPPTPFEGSIAELGLVGGPFELPLTSAQRSFAVQAKVIGAKERSAAVYCSGWLALGDRGLDIACRLDLLPLAAFAPYYDRPGALQVRVYDATLKATARLTAKSNDLTGRIRLEIGNLSEADLSVFGRTVADVKQLAGEGPPVLSGEVQIAGALDRLDQWELTLIPGNEIVRDLIKPLLDRRIGTMPVRLGEQTIPVGIAPATEEAMSDVSAVSQHEPSEPPAAPPEAPPEEFSSTPAAPEAPTPQ